MSELDETPTVTHDPSVMESDDDESRGTDGLTDDERRHAKQERRDAEQKQVDRDGDAERARIEREHGEAEGARGRNAGTESGADPATGVDSAERSGATEKDKPVKATGRGARTQDSK